MLDRLYKILVQSNLWVGLAAACLCGITFFALPSTNWYYCAFLGAATVAIYNYIHLFHEKFPWKKLRERQVDPQWGSVGQISFQFFLFSFATAYLLWEILSIDLLLWLLPPGILSLIYPITFERPAGSSTSMRTIPGLKLLVISFCWAWMTYLIPIVLYSEWEPFHYVGFFFRMVFVAALVIPFDIRDKTQDKVTMRTLPQVLGINNARAVAIFMITICQLWAVAEYFFFTGSIHLLFGQLVGLEIAYWLINLLGYKVRGKWYCAFWIEGVPIYMVIIITLSRYF